MIAEWMVYCALCTLGLLAAATIVERWLLRDGGQVRHVWSIALLFAIAIPAGTYWLSPRQTITIPSTISIPVGDLDPSALASTSPATDAAQTRPVTTSNQSFQKLIPTNKVAIAIWIVLSTALGIYFIAGLIAIARMRRQWRPTDVCGVHVLVSDRTGPAVINPFSPKIVMPEWALSMDRYQLGLMIRHEQEHRRAGDPQLLALAQLALIAMPWNPALWWGVMRLGLAVELDCDARVLRTADPRTYGDLLLEVARPRRHPRLIAAAAFAERAGGLERRIRAIARPRSGVARGARAGAAVVGLAVMGIAWAAPHPSLPPRWSAVPPTHVAGKPTDAAVHSDNAKPAEVRPETLKTVRQESERVYRGDTVVLPPVKAQADDVVIGTPHPAFSPLDSLIYERLFTGVVLSPDQELAARLLLSNLADLQAQQDQKMVAVNVQGSVTRVQLNHERDSLFFALLSTEAERDLLASRLANTQVGGGRRGRSGNSPVLNEIPVGAPAGGGPRSGGRGRVGGGGDVGGGTSTQEVPASSVVDNVLFALLFDGINLSPDQEATARSILTTYRQKVAATIPDPLPFQLRMVGTADVLMRPESRAALLAILSSDADRAIVDSRIVTEVRVVNRQLPAPPTR